jgi:cytochrome c oxidase cbb3-type subunit I/II
MINGLLTLRGAWHKVAADPILKFFVVGVTFYGMSTFEGPMLSVKSVNALSHYTDWTIAHVHAGALGWNGFLTFGMIYWLAPRLFQTPLWSRRLMATHFWIGTIGILLYVIPIYTAGITQGLMWRAFDESGRLQYPDFVETVVQLLPFYWFRVAGGTLFLLGAVLMGVNVLMTWRKRPTAYAEPVHTAAALSAVYRPEPRPAPRLAANTEWGKAGDVWLQGWWHRVLEGKPAKFTLWVIIAVAGASILEIVPVFLIRSNVPTISSVTPYTPLELAGREIYIAEGCYNCHSQMIRPLWAETKRYGEYSKPGEFVYDHPFQWGSRRIGPDLAREGGKQSHDWHVRHLEDPRQLVGQSIMPAYPHLLDQDLDFGAIQSRVDVMAMLGVPYGNAVKAGVAEKMAREQADLVSKELAAQGGRADLGGKKIIALVAYLQRLGTDISKPADAAPAPTPAPAASGSGTTAKNPQPAPAGPVASKE